MTKFWSFLFIGMFLALGNLYAMDVFVPKDEAEIWANQKGAELIRALGMTDIIKKHATLDRMLTEDVNLNYVSQFVIGKYGKKMNENQKRKYSDLFNRYILSMYKRFNLEFNANDINFSIDKVEEHNKFTSVECLVDTSRLIKDVEIEKIPVEFKLIKTGKGKIQAVDLEISNVSLVLEYRKKFYRMVMEEDEVIDWFLEKFEDKVIANEDAIKKISGL